MLRVRSCFNSAFRNPNSPFRILFADLGRYSVVEGAGKTEGLKGAFKTPTPRNITLTAPYMHDGSQKTLEEVVDFYDKEGHPNPYLDPQIKPLNLAKQEESDLVEFMKSLTSDDMPTIIASMKRP